MNGVDWLKLVGSLTGSNAVAGATASEGRFNDICTELVALAAFCEVSNCRSVIVLLSKLPFAAGGNTCRRWPLAFVT